jgi:hypothetical protein
MSTPMAEENPELPQAQREARLRAEAAELYPKLVPGRWVLAAALVPVVVRERARNGLSWDGQGRALPKQHFEFRGGAPRGPLWIGLPSRLSDG